MVHYSCDGCGKILESADDVRYKVKIETYIASDNDEDECFDNGDILSNSFDYENDEEYFDEMLEDIEYNTLQFDLCISCYKDYQQNPLSKKRSPKKRFSEN